MSLLSPPLQAFVAIARHKTVHGAARAIHLTQTAVTQRLRQLESKLAVTLFLRTRRGMLLTAEGEALLRYCTALQDLESETLGQIKGTAVSALTRINITGPNSMMRSRIIPQCIPVMQRYPNLLLHFDIDDTDRCIKSLRTGNSQFAVVQQEEVMPEMASKNLAPERYVLVCSAAWRERGLSDIVANERIIDYDPTDQMTFNYLKKFHLGHLARHDRHFANRTDVLAMLLVAGQGYGTLTMEFSRPYVEQGQLIVLNEGKKYLHQMALAWYHRPQPPDYFAALLKALS